MQFFTYHHLHHHLIEKNLNLGYKDFLFFFNILKIKEGAWKKKLKNICISCLHPQFVWCLFLVFVLVFLSIDLLINLTLVGRVRVPSNILNITWNKCNSDWYFNILWIYCPCQTKHNYSRPCGGWNFCASTCGQIASWDRWLENKGYGKGNWDQQGCVKKFGSPTPWRAFVIINYLQVSHKMLLQTP